jgi:hypothetical protein
MSNPNEMGLLTDILAAVGGTGTSSPRVQGTAASGAAAVGNPVQIGGLDGSGNMLAPTVISGTMEGLSPNQEFLCVNASLYTFDVAASQHRLARGDSIGLHTVAKPGTSGGLTATRVVTGTSGVIKASAGQLFKLHSVRNSNAAVRYLHLYDKATAPTLSTDTPVLTISLAASSVQNDIDIGGDIGVAFANGIAWAATTDNVAIPTTAATSGETMFAGAYK